MLTELLNVPGEHNFQIPGGAGIIEGQLFVPNQPSNYMAILGHPHSLQGGTMNNKVVTTMVRVFKELGIACIRINFRGVGQSGGTYDAGVGESDDLLMIRQQCLQARDSLQFIFAGFSFGSYVTYRAAAQCPHALLISIAPSVQHYDYEEFTQSPSPWAVLHGDLDEIVSIELVRDFVRKSAMTIDLHEFSQTTHFFHGKLLDLRACLVKVIQQKVPDVCR